MIEEWVVITIIVVVTVLLWRHFRKHYRNDAAERNDISLHEMKPAPSLPKRLLAGTQLMTDLPKEYDVRKEYPFYSARRTDQDTCGSCWSMASVFSLEERMQIATGGASKVRLGPQFLINCEHLCEDMSDPETCDAGCHGGYLEHAWVFLVSDGCPEEACMPFVNERQKCTRKCVDGSEPRFYRAKEAYSITDPDDSPETNSKRIQLEILANGPVTAGMDGFMCFREWDGEGVYRRKKGTESIGGHAVRLIGWGESKKGGKYWLGANSWGEHWGDNGYFKIARGDNECDIEADVSCGIPDV